MADLLRPAFYATNEYGHRPVWANSLFKDNAEFGILPGIPQRRAKLAENAAALVVGENTPEYIKAADQEWLDGMDDAKISNTSGARKKDLDMIAISCGYVYADQVAMSDPAQVLKAMTGAEAYHGPSLIIAYAPCINHGIKIDQAQTEIRKAVAAGYWQTYRYNPAAEGKKFTLNSRDPTEDYQAYIQGRELLCFPAPLVPGYRSRTVRRVSGRRSRTSRFLQEARRLIPVCSDCDRVA